LFLAGMVTPPGWTAEDGHAKGEAAGSELFGLTRVVKLHVEIAADEFQAMQPPAPAGAPGGPSPAPRPKRPGGRDSERNLFGVEFPWARGDLVAESQTCKGVRLRYSGNASYMASAWGLKRSLLVELDRPDHADFHGLRAMSLQ